MKDQHSEASHLASSLAENLRATFPDDIYRYMTMDFMHSSIYQPRIDPAARFQDQPLPSLDDVRSDVASAEELRFTDLPPFNVLDSLGELMPVVGHNQKLQLLLPKLFDFSNRANVDDIPEDLRSECLWALQVRMANFMDTPDEKVRKLNYPDESSAPFMLSIRNNMQIAMTLKLFQLLVEPPLNCPIEAVSAFRFVMKLAQELNSTFHDDQWEHNPSFFLDYGIVLSKTHQDDDEAKKVLERYIPLADTQPNATRAKLYLSRILRRTGFLSKAEILERELVLWLEKNPHAFFDRALRIMFDQPNSETGADPILTELGGSNWLTNRKHTTKTDHRLTKKCHHCFKDSSQVTLRRCSGCNHIYYCSNECLRADWKQHKAFCRDIAATRNDAQKVAESDPDRAVLFSDWTKWNNETHAVNRDLLVHALSIHRNPGRAWTHIVLTQVKHNPTARVLRHKFTVISCGVFEVTKILKPLEAVMGLEAGEGQEYVDSCLQGLPATTLPLLSLTICPRVRAWLGCVRQQAYDANWREKMNRKGISPPEVIGNWEDAPNAEHIF